MFGLTLLAGLAGPTQAAETPAAIPPATQPAEAAAKGLPHITIDRQAGTIDIEATVAVRNVEWLELLLCSTNTREYESLLVTKAKPSHVHLALLLLGQQPGSPMLWLYEGEKLKVVPARGPKVRVTLRYEKEGKTVEIPAHQWLIDQKTKKPPDESPWIFAGSRFDKKEDREIFQADVFGSLISLVNFGDDVLVLRSQLKNYSGEFPWAPNNAEIPPAGTKVTVRLQPLDPPSTQPTTTQPAQP